jgi:predicted N-acyltransferase
MVAAAEQLAGDFSAASISFLYVDEDDALLRKVLAERGYGSFASGEVSLLRIPPGGFDGYLNALGRHRRRRVLAERRRCEAAGVSLNIEPLSASLIPRLARLETWLYHKYGLRHWQPDMSVRALSGILDVLAGTALVCLARAGGDIRGFGLILPFRDVWCVHRSGFDYDFQGNLPLYFETLFYHPIEAAAPSGVSTLMFGTGSADTKRSRGCLTSTQRAYVRMLTPR